MKRKKQTPITNLETGVPGLDSVLGGGLPKYSFNLIAGGPGAGKTTLSHQIMFANATAEKPALYFTVLGEPTLKMLRYQQQFSFFDADLAGSAIQFVNLSEQVLSGNLEDVLNTMIEEITKAKPGMVFVDSFRTFSGRLQASDNKAAISLENFIQRLACRRSKRRSARRGECNARDQRASVP
jgi:circadian clock protein KaiC